MCEEFFITYRNGLDTRHVAMKNEHEQPAFRPIYDQFSKFDFGAAFSNYSVVSSHTDNVTSMKRQNVMIDPREDTPYFLETGRD